MLDALDEANTPKDTDETTKVPSSSPTSGSIVHTKLGAPITAVTTFEEFTEVSAGPGNPLPRTFKGKLEAFLNNFCAANQPSHATYPKVRKEDKVPRFILTVCGLLT
jgi:hypothetical protein